MGRNSIILYNLPNENGKVQVVIKDETLWCTQKTMAQLYDVGVPAISKYIIWKFHGKSKRNKK